MSFFTRCSGALTFKLLVAFGRLQYFYFDCYIVSFLDQQYSKTNLDMLLFTIVCLSLNLYLA